MLFDEEATEGEDEEKQLTEDKGKIIDPTGNGEGYASILYNNSNGLPTSEANAIAETPDGFIWIGGYSGLTRYDGNTFKRYD